MSENGLYFYDETVAPHPFGYFRKGTIATIMGVATVVPQAPTGPWRARGETPANPGTARTHAMKDVFNAGTGRVDLTWVPIPLYEASDYTPSLRGDLAHYAARIYAQGAPVALDGKDFLVPTDTDGQAAVATLTANGGGRLRVHRIRANGKLVPRSKQLTSAEVTTVRQAQQAHVEATLNASRAHEVVIEGHEDTNDEAARRALRDYDVTADAPGAAWPKLPAPLN